jgi:hypothetical protein
MARDGAADVVRYGHAEVVPARVAGGGYISIVGIATIEFCVRDSVSGEWQPFKERFHLVEGTKTCILGMTFHQPRGLRLDLDNAGLASYVLDNGSRLTTEVEVQARGMIASAVATSDPLVFTDDTYDVGPYGFSLISCRVPEMFNGSTIHLSRLLASDSSYFAKMGLTVPDSNFTVADGRVSFPVFNPGGRAVHVPKMVPVGRYSADMEIRSCASQMSVEDIVGALHIESVDPTELAAKKADVALLITALRQGYLSSEQIGRVR